MPWPTDRDLRPGRVLVGTSGYVYPHRRSRFYPPGVPGRDWLPFYARRFGTVELNNPFYHFNNGARGAAIRRPGGLPLATPHAWYGS